MSKTRLVIIEGCDRVGKDTLIAGLQNSFQRTETIHWGYPIGDNNEEKTAYQQFDFERKMVYWKEKQADGSLELLIWNRSHLGENVYGTMYRDSYPNTWVPQLEEKYLSDDTEIFLVLLVADPEFIAAQDDGLSYSARIDDKRQEVELFVKSFHHSCVGNKKFMMVHDENGYYPASTILQNVINFISQ